MNKIQGNYSAGVLDIATLESIEHPALSVGSYISVYNAGSINAMPYASELNKIETNRQLYEHFKTLGDVIKMQEYQEKLHSSVATAINKYNQIHSDDEGFVNITTYGELQDKLYHDKLYVSTITKVLREPLKNSITVEEGTSYKSILFRLIKST